MNTDRPLERLGSIKAKLGVLVVASVLIAAIVSQVGELANVSAWLTVPVTVAGTLMCALWLARGMTQPLREMTAAAARMATGNYAQRVQATSADEVGELGRAFNTMAADLEKVDQQRRDLIATVSHELRTPLTAQQALLENLVDGVVQPDDDSLRTALAQSERLSTLVSDLLDLSRVEAGVARLDIAPVDLEALVAQAIAEARSAATRPVEFEAHVPPMAVEADAGRLAQVLANLLDNAVRHGPAGGTVTVRCADLGDQWSLEVADEGAGISPQDAVSIFDRFGVSSGGGTGLGLAIANSACQLHGGSISVQPSDVGARLRAVLPKHPAPSPGPTKETPMSTAAPTAPRPEASGPVLPPPVREVWPEQGLSPQPRLVLGALGVGLFAALLLPHRAIGLALLLVVLVGGGFVVRNAVNRTKRWSMAYVGLAAALSSLIVLRAAEWVTVLALFVAGLLLTTALTDARSIGAMVTGWASWVLSGVRGLPLLGRSLDAMSKVNVLWPVLRTGAISLAALVIFGGLFASGDAIFGSWVSAVVPDLNVDGFVQRAFIAFVVGGVVLAATYLAINPPQVERLAIPMGKRVTRTWEWLVPVSIVIALFATFVAAQATAMWGGHDYVQRTTGLTYADTVHQGFGQLTVITFLTLLMVALAAHKAPRETAHERLLLRGALGTLCALALVVVASALYRMSVYQDAYGFTVMRVLVDAFELWLGLVLVLVLVAGIKLDTTWIPRVALLSGAAFVLVIGLANPEAWVAKQNIERYNSTGKIDTYYLSTLSPDVWPTVAKGLPSDLASCVMSSPPADGDWLSWNLGRQRAHAYGATAPDADQMAHCSRLATPVP